MSLGMQRRNISFLPKFKTYLLIISHHILASGGFYIEQTDIKKKSEFAKMSANIHIVMLQAYMCYYSDL